MKIESVEQYYELCDVYCLEDEIWKDILDFEGIYQVSNFGRIRSLDRYLNSDKEGKFQFKKGCIIKPNIVFGGYWQASLYNNGVRKVKKFHRLVALAFIENIYNKREVNHLDRNKCNNGVSNLEWCTPKENMKHLEDEFDFDYGRRKVRMFDMQGIFIKEFKSIASACEYIGLKRLKNGKFCGSNISLCLNNDEKRKSAYGYKWEYSITP